MTFIRKRALGLLCLMTMTIGCGHKQEEPLGPVLCSVMISMGPYVDVVDTNGAPVAGARVGFTSFDLASSPPPNNGECTENPYVAEEAYYSCFLTDAQIQVIQQIRDHQRSGTAGISVEKAGYKTSYQEISDVQYATSRCWRRGYISTPNYFKVVLEPEPSS